MHPLSVISVRLGAAAFLATSLAACSATQQADVQPEPSTPSSRSHTSSNASPQPARTTPSYRVFEAVVIQPWAAADTYDVSDTITVDLRIDRTRSATVPVIRNGARAGSIPIALIGPRNAGRMVVNTRALNVRKCGSTRCEVIGSLSEGDLIRVEGYANGWYQLSPAGNPVSGGYVFARHLVLPESYLQVQLGAVTMMTRMFFDQGLSRLSGRNGPLFTSYQVDVLGSPPGPLTWAWTFRTPYISGYEVQSVCSASRQIAQFILDVVYDIPEGWAHHYRARVYWDNPHDSRTNIEVVSIGESIVCQSF